MRTNTTTNEEGLRQLYELLTNAQSRLFSLINDNKSTNRKCRECGRKYTYDEDVGYAPTICGPMCHGIEIGSEREQKRQAAPSWKSPDDKPRQRQECFVKVRFMGEVNTFLSEFHNDHFRDLQCSSWEQTNDDIISGVIGWLPIEYPQP